MVLSKEAVVWRYSPKKVFSRKMALPEKCPYSEFFWSVFSHIRTEFSPNAEKYGPEKLRIRTLFMQCGLQA